MREFSKQNQELLRQALEEAQAELIKKFQIIQEVRAHLRTRNQESLPCNRGNPIDETEVQRELQKEQLQKEQQQREQQVVAMRKEKQQKEQQLREAMETIELYRKVNAKAAVARFAKSCPC